MATPRKATTKQAAAEPEQDQEQATARDDLGGQLPADHPARQAMLAELRDARDTLRGKLGGADADELIMLRAEVQALSQAAARAGVFDRPRYMSEGVREEIERVGFAVDPTTGDTLTRDDLPGK